MSSTGPLGANYTLTSTTQKFALGLKYFDPGVVAEFEYVNASAAISQYDAVMITDSKTASQLTTTNAGAIPGAVGVAQVAIASGSYGWVLRRGGIKGGGLKLNVLASCLKNVKLYTTATAGAIDDTATTLVSGLQLTTDNGGSTAAVECTAVRDICVNE